MGAIVFLSITFVDRVVYPAYVSAFLKVRILVAILFWIGFALTFLKSVQNHIIWLSDLTILVIGFALNYLFYISVGIESLYYEGINQIFLGMLIMNSFFLRHTIIVGLLIILAYILAVLGNPTVIPFFGQIFLHKVFILILTLFLLCLMTQIYKTQHYREFVKSEEVLQTVEKLDEANRKLRSNEKLKDEFFATVSHELRTPLTLTLAPTESLLAGEAGAITDDQRHLLQTIHNNAIRLLQMVSGLLDFSRLEAGQIQVSREPLDIVAITRSALDDFAPLFRQKKLLAEFSAEADPSWILMDRYIYDRILFNLISNAAKFTPPEGQIKVALKIQDQKLTLAVTDTGIGIAPEDIPRLFKKFNQLESSSIRRFEGAGLGLALVKQFATLLGGDISVQSTLGKGSTFTVECAAPVSTTAVSGNKTKAAYNLTQTFVENNTAKPLSTSSRSMLPKVLVAEDNLELANYIKVLLQDFCQLQIVADGDEALEVAERWLPDLILTDVMMPKKDGITLCKEIKANPATLKIPVVLITALTHRDAMLRGWEAGADEYLFKPFHPKELTVRVRSLLSNIAVRQDADQVIFEKNAATSHAKAELEQLQLFAFAATHDLQEPLKNIMLQTDILENQGAELHLSDEVLQRLGRLRSSALRMSKMIEQLRIFANVKAAATPFQKVDLNKVIQNILIDLEPRIDATGAKIHVDTLPSLAGDKTQLHRLFQNILANALKFTSRDETPRIFVRAKHIDDKQTEISVEDNGIGFDEKYAALIFKPFERLHTHSQYEGSGMGLSICQKIVLRHGGKISVKSKLGEGTTFTVRLPYQSQDLLVP